MLISTAMAASDVAGAPSGGAMESIMLIVILVILFYVLLIMPQQRRFKEHNRMLDGLQKGDKVITAGGLIGKIDKLKDDNEVIVDLGNNLKVTALRTTIQTKMDDTKK